MGWHLIFLGNKLLVETMLTTIIEKYMCYVPAMFQTTGSFSSKYTIKPLIEVTAA